MITWHYDGTPPWPTFSLSDAGGNTTLTWSGQTIPVGATIHVGFDVAGASLPVILGMNWLNAGAVVGNPVQGCFHTWNNFNGITFNNCLNIPGLSILSASVEFYPDVLALDLMNSNVSRFPLSSNAMAFDKSQTMPGGAMLLQVPPAPPNALYGMFTIQLADATGQWATTDYLLLPMDKAFPPLLTTVGFVGGMVNFTFSAMPGRIYHLQSSTDLINWGDAALAISAVMEIRSTRWFRQAAHGPSIGSSWSRSNPRPRPVTDGARSLLSRPTRKKTFERSGFVCPPDSAWQGREEGLEGT